MLSGARLDGEQVSGSHNVAVLERARRLRAQLAHVARIPALRAPVEQVNARTYYAHSGAARP